jgi:hypothetical protein
MVTYKQKRGTQERSLEVCPYKIRPIVASGGMEANLGNLNLHE